MALWITVQGHKERLLKSIVLKDWFLCSDLQIFMITVFGRSPARDQTFSEMLLTTLASRLEDKNQETRSNLLFFKNDQHLSTLIPGPATPGVLVDDDMCWFDWDKIIGCRYQIPWFSKHLEKFWVVEQAIVFLTNVQALILHLAESERIYQVLFPENFVKNFLEEFLHFGLLGIFGIDLEQFVETHRTVEFLLGR